jgi:hypothetical protein
LISSWQPKGGWLALCLELLPHWDSELLYNDHALPKTVASSTRTC